MAVKPNSKGVVTGTKDKDTITWISSADWKKALTVNAGAGNDLIDFKKSTYANTINGEAGDDTIYGGTVADTIKGGAGKDLIYGYNGKDSIFGDAGNDTIYGGNGDDYLNGGANNDKLYGGTGTDTVMGGDGDDSLYGDDGIDSVVGGNGNDYIEGGAGFGRLFGLTGNDTIYGEKDKDTIDGGDDDDELHGGEDSDTVKGNTGNDLIYGDDGDDYLYGMKNNDTLYGGKGNDLLDGSEGNDSLMGEDGNDVIRAGAGDDYANGGTGNDTIQGHSGNDTIYGGAGDDFIEGNDGDDKVYGQAGKDLIRGGNGNDYLDGGDDNDTIQGQSGKNTILGGNGNDSIEGGSGNDSIDGGNGADKIYGQDGNDTIKAGASNDYVEGGNGDDVIYGQSGNNTLLGGAGNDKIIAGTGNDRINAGSGTNSIQFTNNAGTNTILNGGGTDTLVLTSVTNLNNIETSWSDNDLVIQSGNTNIVLNGYKTTENHSVKYIQAGSTKKSISDVLPATPYDMANMVVGTDGDDTLSLNFGEYKEGIYDNQQFILKTEYGATQNWINKYTTDLQRQAQKVSDKYESVKTVLQNIKWTEYLIANYDNPDYKGDTFFRRWSKEYWEDELASYKSGAYGYRYTWENYRDTQLADYTEGTAEYNEALADLYYSIEYARYQNLCDNLEKYQGYADDPTTIPTFRDIAIAHGYTQENGYLYWENKAAGVMKNIEGFTGLKEIYETLRDSGTATEDEIAAAYQEWQDASARYNLYLEYAHNYYNEEYLGEGYQNTIEDKTYLSFRQEAEAESQKKIIHDYAEGRYRYRTGEEYWYYRAEMLNREINGYEGAEARYEYFYRLSRDGNPLSIYYDLYREARDEFDDYADEYNRYARYNNYWSNQNYTGEPDDDSNRDADYWGGQIQNINNSLNGSVYIYNTEVDNLNSIVQYIKDNAPSDEALQILTHLANGMIITGDGDDDITIGHVDTSVEYPSSGDVFAMGQGGNDTYKIEYFTSNSYNDVRPISIEILDHEGTNTIKFMENVEELKSGNIGIYANVTLVRDDNGVLVKDANGNYQYTIENFRTYTGNTSGNDSCISYSPMKNGDAGYALLIVDAKTYSYKYAFDYGAMNKKGVKLDSETLNHLDKIYSADGKYITRTQLDAMFQKTANKLAEMGYDSFMDAMCLDSDSDYQTKENNLYQLTSSECLGSLEWIGNEGVIDGATSGLVGTNTNDTLTSSNANETFDLKLGNDTISFTGEFGNDIIKSESTVDNYGNARQADTLNLAEYSVTDGTLRFSQNGNDLVLTAYDDDKETVKGTITYKNFLNGETYNSRKFVLNAQDHTYMVWFNEAQPISNPEIMALDIDDESNTNYNIRFIKGANDGGKVRFYANSNYSEYHVLDNTPIVLYPKDGETVNVVTNGNGDDYYPIHLNEDTNIIINDGGGNDTITLDGGWSEVLGDAKMRFFFDITDEGIVSDAKHIIWTDNFYIPTTDKDGNKSYYYATENLIKLLNNDSDHMKGVITFTGDIENIQNDNHPSALYPYSLDYEKIKASMAVDLVPWLKENNYASVKDALTQLQAGIDEKQEAMNEIDVSGEEVPAEYTELKEQRDALQAKVDELLGLYNQTYEYIINKNIIATDEADSITATGWTRYIDAGKGNDIIDLTTGHSDVKLMYDFTRGDGHDTLINALRPIGVDKEDTIHINIGKTDMTPKFRADGWDLILEMYADSESTENPDGSIRIKNYFFNKYSRRIDTVVIHSLDNNNEEVMETLSISEMIEDTDNYGLLNPDITLYTNGNDVITGTDGNDIIYTNGAPNADTITSSSGNDTYYITSEDDNMTSDRYRRAKLTYTPGNGDDVIYGADYMTYLTLDYNNQEVSLELRKSDDNDLRMVFFDYEGNDLGSITVKDSDISWNPDGTIYTGYGSTFLTHLNTDTFFIKKNADDEGTAYKLNNLVKQYKDMGASLTENNDTPYIRIIKITNGTQDGLEITNIGKIDRLVFDEAFDNVTGEISGNDLVLTYGTNKTVVVKGYVSGNSSVYDVNINGEYTTLGDLAGLYYGTTGDDTFIHSTEENVIKTYNLNTGNDTVEFPQTRNAYDAYDDGTVLYNKAVINSQGGTQYTDTIRLHDYSLGDNKLRFGYTDDGLGITIKGEKDFNPTTLINYHKFTDITYNNFMLQSSPNLKIEMYYSDYSNSYFAVHKYNSTQNLDTYNSFDYAENTAHVLFIKASSGKSNITSGSYSNAHVVTTGGAALNFTGHDGDIIVTNSTSSNDTYNMDYQGATVFITDKGGTNDILNFQDMYEGRYGFNNLFLSFNLNADGTAMDSKFAISYAYSSEGALYNMAQRVLAGKTDIQPGVAVVDAAKQNGKNIGIEHVYGCSSDWTHSTLDANGFNSAQTTRLGEINMESWYNAIKTDVVAWMTNEVNAAWMEENDLHSTKDVFAYYADTNNGYEYYESLTAAYENHDASMYLK